MKKRISLLLVFAMILSFIPVAYAAEAGETLVSVTNESVTETGYTAEFHVDTAGTMTVIPGKCDPGWRYRVYGPDYEGVHKTQYALSHDLKITAGDWKVVFFAYGGSAVGDVAGTVSFDVVFASDESGAVQKTEYEVSKQELALGDNTLTLLDTAVTTIYKFEASETAVYTFTAPEGAILGYWGAGSWFLSDPKSNTNTYEWTCTGVGQSAYIGVSGVEGEFNLNVAKTGDYTVVELPIVPYENKATLEAFTIPTGAKLGSYVDVYGETHTAVRGSDGYYHLDSADGDVLLIDLNYMDIVLSAALNSDRPVMYARTTDENGNDVKYDIGNAIKAYEAVMDENGYYPVTEDILLFYQVYAVQVGTFAFHLTGSYNEECVWMYCMRTMNMDNVVVDPDPEEPTDPSEPEETDPSEPTTPSEPSEPVSGEIVLNESVTAASAMKYTYSYQPTDDGILTVTVGDGSTNWNADIVYFQGALMKTVVTASGSAATTFSAEATAGTTYRIRVWNNSGALAETPVLAVFTPAGGTTPEPSEPETEPTEPSVPTEPSEPETEPSEPETQPTEPSVPSVPDENVPAGTKYALVSGSDVTYYSSATAGSINNVIKAAPVGAMIILYDDIDLGTSSTCFEVYTGSEIILDLNGHTMTYSYANIGTVYVAGGKLTVQDSSAEGTGMITSTHKNGVAIEVYTGTLIFEGGNASSKIGAKVWANASMTMAGGSISGSQYAVNALANSVVTVSGGELVQSTAGSFNYSLFAAGTATMSITGGYFNGNVSGSGLNGKISGGYYTVAVSAAYIASGYERQANDDATYIYKVVDPNATETDPSEPTVPTEPVKDAYAVSTTVLSVGSNTVSMIETAEATLFKFTPAEAGTYIITGPEGSKVGIWGLSSNVKDPNSTSNSCELTLANAGPTARVGVTGAEGQIVLTITKYEEPIDPSEPDQTEPSEPVESGTLLTLTNEEVTASGYTFEYTAATAGTLNVTVGECSPGWRYKITMPNGTESLYRTKNNATETCDYEGEAGKWIIKFYAYSSAEDENVAGTLSVTVTFTPDEQEVAGPQELVSVTNEAVTADGYTYTFHAETTGTLNVTVGECSPGWQYKVIGPNYNSGNRGKYTAGDTCDYAINEAGEWKVLFYAYTSAEGHMEGTVSFTLTFTPDQGGGEVEKAEYEISETELVLGDNTLTLLDTAVTTIYVFKPTETGVYTFTAPAGAILGYWGAGSWFLSNPNSTTNTYEWTCTGVGQTAYMGVSGVDGEFNLNVAKTGDYEVIEIPIVAYENKATLEKFTLPQGATLGSYVDVYGQTHTAVLGADGYYHLDSADGDILLIDLNYMDIILSAALNSDRPVMYARTTDENGNDVKYDIGNAIKAYEAVMDENGYYPVTEDILLFYQVYAMQAGTFAFHLTGDYNEECVWMYCMRTVKLPDYVAAVYADGEQIAQYTTVADAIAACTEGQYVVLIADVTEDITVNGQAYLDLAGFTLTGSVSGEGTLYLADSATDDFEGAYGKLIGTVTVTVNTFVEMNGKSYLVVNRDGAYSAHCYDVVLTHISLDPANDALGYKAALYGDEIVQQYVTGFGFKLWVDNGEVKTYSKTGTQNLTLRLKNILAAGGGEMGIHATAFVTLTVGEEAVTKTGDRQTTTMKETLQAVNGAWETYSQAQKDAVVALCEQYKNVTSQWELDNIFGEEQGVIDIPIVNNPDGNP